jgi:hypothetical protein
MDVGKEREQERKLFRRSDCRKHPFSLSLEPAYLCPVGIPAYAYAYAEMCITTSSVRWNDIFLRLNPGHPHHGFMPHENSLLDIIQKHTR